MGECVAYHPSIRLLTFYKDHWQYSNRIQGMCVLWATSNAFIPR